GRLRPGPRDRWATEGGASDGARDRAWLRRVQQRACPAALGRRLSAASLLSRHDGPALVYGEHELDYGALDNAAARLAARIGPLAGLRVVVIAPNVPALVVAMLAGWRAGAVVVPVNARLREHELSRIVLDAEPTVVLSVREHLGYASTE